MNHDQTGGPVFIVGMNGSGTTMLLDHLGNHPGLYGFPVETRVLPYYLRGAERFGNLCEDKNFLALWHLMRGLFPIRKANANAAVPLPADWKETRRSVAGIFDRLMRHFSQQAGKTRWAEKSPMYVMHIATLSQAFPDAKFIHMVRDGRDCAASFHRRWRYHPARTVLRWKQVIREGRRQAADSGVSYLEVSYEEITREPEAVLRKTCDFLELPFDAAVLQSSRQRLRMKGTDAKAISRNPRNYSSYFRARQLARLDRIAGRTLAELGYATEYPRADLDPPAWKATLWAFKDRTWYVYFEIRNKLREGKERPWHMVLGRFKSALQQKSSTRF